MTKKTIPYYIQPRKLKDTIILFGFENHLIKNTEALRNKY